MARRTSLKQTGQALIELVFAVIILVVTISMAGGLAVSLREKFKHGFVKLNRDETLIARQDELSFKKNLILFDIKNKEPQAEDVVARGWTENENTAEKSKKFRLFEKDNQQLLLIKNLGVISCLKNCD